MLWVNSADDKLMLFFQFFLEIRIWHVMQIVSLQFAWNVKSYLKKKKIRKIFQNVICWNFYSASKSVGSATAWYKHVLCFQYHIYTLYLDLLTRVVALSDFITWPRTSKWSKSICPTKIYLPKSWHFSYFSKKTWNVKSYLKKKKR